MAFSQLEGMMCVGTLSCIPLLATNLLGILGKSFNLCLSFFICKARWEVFSIFLGVLDESQCKCKNIIALASDLNKSPTRVPEVLQVRSTEHWGGHPVRCLLRSNAATSRRVLCLQPHLECPRGWWLQSLPCPWWCKEATPCLRTWDIPLHFK